MLTFLVQLLIVLIVLAIVYWIITLIPLPLPLRNIALIVVLLIFLVWFLGFVGVLPGARIRVFSRGDSAESIARSSAVCEWRSDPLVPRTRC